MKKQFLKLYSRNKRKVWESDVIHFPTLTSERHYCATRYNNFLYTDTDNDIQQLRFVDKKGSARLFYVNRWKQMLFQDLQHLPFDTEHYITQEVIGTSVYATRKNNRRFVFTRLKYRDTELENLLREDLSYRFIIDKYGKNWTLEFKRYQNEVYLVNAFNENGVMPYPELAYISEYYEIKVPKQVLSQVFKRGIRELDTFYNDYYLDSNNMIQHRNYYATFFFHNKNFLLVKV